VSLVKAECESELWLSAGVSLDGELYIIKEM
jgi:hypothetical protein